MQMLGISELEKASGFPRTTIYHYLREGLLPPAKRTGGGPAVYGSRHLARLCRIRELKDEALSLEEIRTQLEANGEPTEWDDIDLAAEQTAATRNLILETASRHFAEQGYTGTRMADIASQSGVGPLTLYRYFPSKRELFIEVVETLVERTLQYTEERILAEPDLVKRHMMRVIGFLGVRNVSPEMLTFVRAEALGTDENTRELFIRTYQTLTRPIFSDLELLRQSGSASPRTSDEMMAYALLGVIENSAMRLSWDQEYSAEDYLWTNFEAFAAIQAIYLGELSIEADTETYEPLLRALAANPPFAFPVPHAPAAPGELLAEA
jgi:AcrR family transcriptional regulator